MAKATKRPLPENPLAAMIKEALRRREEAKMAKTAKGQGVSMSEPGRTMSGKKVGTQGYLIEGEFEEMKGRMRGADESKKSPENRAAAIKEGLFTEKNGDLMPTAKYQEYKKAGKLGKFIK